MLLHKLEMSVYIQVNYGQLMDVCSSWDDTVR